MEILGHLNKLKKTKTLNDVFINKKLINTIEYIRCLIALRKLSTFALEDKKNNDLGYDLIKAHNEISKEHKIKFMERVYKLYSYKILNNYIKKLFELQQKKVLEQKAYFMNKLNLIAINGKEFRYKSINSIKKQAKILIFQFKKKEKEMNENDLLENKLKSNVIAFNTIIPNLLDYINDICRKRKKKIYNLIKLKSRNERIVKLFKSYINKNYSPEKEKFIEYLKTNKRIQETEGPLQSELFKLLRKNIINIMFNENNMKELARLLTLLKLFKLTIINKELSEERWLRTLIRKWRFLAFSKSMAKKKLAYLYKHFHVNYLEMANNVFGEQESNPSIIKEFERFGSNVGIWENEKPDFTEQIKKAKIGGRSITFTTPGLSFYKIINDKSEDKNKYKKVEEDEKRENHNKTSKKDEKEQTGENKEDKEENEK